MALSGGLFLLRPWLGLAVLGACLIAIGISVEVGGR